VNLLQYRSQTHIHAPDALPPTKGATRTHWLWFWVGPRPTLVFRGRYRSLAPARNRTTISRFTDCTIPASFVNIFGNESHSFPLVYKRCLQSEIQHTLLTWWVKRLLQIYRLINYRRMEFFFPQDRDCIKQLSTSRNALLDVQAHQSTKCNYVCSLYVSQCRIKISVLTSSPLRRQTTI
jgi:hypothetical protein